MLKVQDLHVSYRSEHGAVRAVNGVSFTVQRGQFYTLLGPSGCGKTSTLRAVAGLETPTHGPIEIGSTVVYSSDRRTIVPTHRRDIGMVFQNYAIWPHMTVFDNVAFPLLYGSSGVSPKDARDKVMRALSLVQLEGYANRPAPDLSGGQQQRVALARAITREPEVLLLDEPLSNLDAKLREEMRQEIKSLVRRLEITTLYVTHDQLEALSMSDTVALIRDGVVIQEGTPREVYLHPADAFAANFLGRTNLLEGRVSPGLAAVATDWGELRVTLPGWAQPGDRVTLGFRPEAAILLDSPPGDRENVMDGRVASIAYSGDVLEYQVQLGERAVRVRGQPFIEFEEGQQVFVKVPAARWYVLDDSRT
jgi:iron(III) transport system ATP-binding protein